MPSLSSMRRKSAILICIAAALLAVSVLAFLVLPSSERPWEKLPVTLLGYTNDATGFAVPSLAATNASQDGFATFRVHNPTRQSFQCFIGPLLVNPTGAKAHSIQLGLSGSPDFHLGAGDSAAFAVPVPDERGIWRCSLVLHPMSNRARWQEDALSLLRRYGMDFAEKTWFVVSPEIPK